MNKNNYINHLVYYMQKIAGIACLTCMILFLCNMGNEMYETLKNIWAAKAFFIFTLFMFITQKVRLLNWQTLFASLFYFPLGYQYRMNNILMPDIFNRDRVVVWTAWLLLLIIVDMIVYGKSNPLQKFNAKALLFFAVMAISMMFYRNGRNHPIVFLLFFVFYFIPIDKLKWQEICNQLCTSWLIAFLIMLLRSIKENPNVTPEVGRWFGAFLNLGDFGIFVACAFTIVFFKLYYTQNISGRKNFLYILYVFCLFLILWVALRVSTITMFLGVFFVILMSASLLFGKKTLYKVALRLTLGFLAICLLGLIGFGGLYLLSNTDQEHWYQILMDENSFLKPIASLIHRAHYMFDKTRTFANSTIFTPGTFINYADLFTSGRLSIIATFSQHFNFSGNPSVGLQVGDYFAFNAHNNYAQTIYEYGYIGGGAFVLWLLYITGASIKQYIQKYNYTFLLLCLWMAMTLGVFLGERANLYAPIIVTTLFLVYPLMVNQDALER